LAPRYTTSTACCRARAAFCAAVCWGLAEQPDIIRFCYISRHAVSPDDVFDNKLSINYKISKRGVIFPVRQWMIHRQFGVGMVKVGRSRHEVGNLLSNKLKGRGGRTNVLPVSRQHVVRYFTTATCRSRAGPNSALQCWHDTTIHDIASYVAQRDAYAPTEAGIRLHFQETSPWQQACFDTKVPRRALRLLDVLDTSQ